MSNISSLSVAELKRAVAIREQIAALEAEFDSLGSGQPVRTAGRRVMSASARARIAAAQRERWARQKGESAGELAPRKRKMSAAARARIAAAQRERWAKAKAAK